MDALEFLARVASHIPDKGQVLQRYYGWYASRSRGRRRKGAAGDAGSPKELTCVRVDQRPNAVREARRRWAELLRRLFEVEPLACPRCGGAMRIVAFITAPKQIDRVAGIRVRHRT